jgi:hypothetical protein
MEKIYRRGFMNFRIEGQELRWRISKEELENLCSGKPLKQTTHFPNGRFLEVVITANPNDKGLSLSVEKERMTLNIEKKAALDLWKALPCREGLESIQHTDQGLPLRLVIDVDIRTQKRKRA